METKQYYYDVAFSFAGEDRKFVNNCAEILRAIGINVFYDYYEKDILAGKDLFSFLGDIYINRSKFAVVFISENYKKKDWTRHELKFINSRVFSQANEYLIPVKLDDTIIDDIPPTIGYINGDTPLNVAEIIAKKLDPKNDINLMLIQLNDLLPNYELKIKDNNVTFKCSSEDFYTEYPLSLMMELYRCDLLFGAFVAPAIVPN